MTSGAGAMVATAMRVVNAVPYVVAAEPGLLSSVDLPLTIPKGAFSRGSSDYSGSRSSGFSTSSMFTSLNVITRTCLTNRAGRYMSHTQASASRSSK